MSMVVFVKDSLTGNTTPTRKRLELEGLCQVRVVDEANNFGCISSTRRCKIERHPKYGSSTQSIL